MGVMLCPYYRRLPLEIHKEIEKTFAAWRLIEGSGRGAAEVVC